MTSKVNPRNSSSKYQTRPFLKYLLVRALSSEGITEQLVARHYGVLVPVNGER